MARATQGSNAQFTYDFGIAIAQSTINRVSRLAGVSLTLASAFYALREQSEKYVSTLRENTLRFKGVLNTMRAMEQAQERLIKGQSYFSVEDQLRGMNQLMAVGLNVGKNIDWINKAAHATGKSFAEFSGMISAAVQGNMSAMVDAGLLTQRATRMFDKYTANTVMRQQAIMRFIQGHKGLMNAIKNDFETVQDQMMRIRATWSSFLQSVLGKPNDPSSFYGQIVSSMKMVAEALAKNAQQIKRYGYIIGQTLGWVIKQIGHFVVWIGRHVKSTINTVWKVTDDYVAKTREMLVWMEFWKLKVVSLFKDYGSAIKSVLKLVLAYKALKWVFIIGAEAIASVIRYRNALLGLFVLQSRYLKFIGGAGLTAKIGAWFTSLAVFMPRWFRGTWIALFKLLGALRDKLIQFGPTLVRSFYGSIGKSLKALSGIIVAPLKGLAYVLAPITSAIFSKQAPSLLRAFVATFKSLGRLILAPYKVVKMMLGSVKGLGAALKLVNVGFKALFRILGMSNPVGWIVTAISLLTTLYAKSKTYREYINSMLSTVWEFLKLIYNLVVATITYVMIGVKKVWNFLKDVFKWFKGTLSSAGDWISDMWGKFKNTTVGAWIDKWIVQPIKWVVDKLAAIPKMWVNMFTGIFNTLKTFLANLNKSIADATTAAAKANGVPTIPMVGGSKTTPKVSVPKKVVTTPKTNKVTPTKKKVANPLSNEGNAPVEEKQYSSMTLEKGAVQIIVEKGQGINEALLAKKVRDILKEIQREQNMRGGM